MPWNYQNRFFQEAPKIYAVDLDKYYKDKKIVQLVSNYYAGIGLPIDNMLKNSDLFRKKERTSMLSAAISIKRVIPVYLGNITPNSNWMGTMLMSLVMHIMK